MCVLKLYYIMLWLAIGIMTLFAQRISMSNTYVTSGSCTYNLVPILATKYKAAEFVGQISVSKIHLKTKLILVHIH